MNYLSRSRINSRAIQIGLEIFERTQQAAPRPWQIAWWYDQGMGLFDHDKALQTRAFEFVDCLPALQNPRQIVEHLAEYFDPRVVNVPKVVHALVAPGKPGCWREDIIGHSVCYGAKMMAQRFIVGQDTATAMRTIDRLRRSGMAFTLDVLGESTTSHARADAYADTYRRLIDEFSTMTKRWPVQAILDRSCAGPMPRVNVSLKLTGLDPHFDAIDPARSIRSIGNRLRPLLRQSREVGAFVNIDMESTKHREITLTLFEQLLMEDEFRDWTDVGIVTQAYLRDGESDLYRLLELAKKRGTRFAIRLVKGAYWDAESATAVRHYVESPVWTRKWESDACYERLARVMIEHAELIRPAFASHNVRSLSVAMATAEQCGLSKHEYEIQMLFGMGDPLKAAVVGLGYCLRVYCPFGDLMPGMGYLIRRLLENTSNDSFLKQSFRDRSSYDCLLRDPAVVQPTSAALPMRFYQNTDQEEPVSTFENATNTNFANQANRRSMAGALEYVRGEMGRLIEPIVDGQSIGTVDTVESLNPSQSSEVMARVGMATAMDVDRAVAAARRSFFEWRQVSVDVRATLLRKVADRLVKRRFELAATMILEVGKPWRDADADVTEAIDHCRYYADQIERIESRPRLRNIPGENNRLVYAPKGVCAVIAPWALPLAILTGMTSAALAGGNTVVVKPARQASLVASKLFGILCEAGFPPGVVNLLTGAGEVVGQHLVQHSDVNIVAFTGSQEVGQEVIRAGAIVYPGQSFIKKMIVEMGGKNAIIVDEDADLDGAVEAVLESAFGFAGQKCSSCSRLIVLDSVYDAMAHRLRDAVESVIVGLAQEPATRVGPVIDQAAVDRIDQYLQLASNQGQRLVQTKLPEACRDGFFVSPTIVDGIAPDSQLAQQEVLGPLLVMLRAKDFDHALRMANDTRYALTGGLYSRRPSHIEQARREFEVGNLYINRKITGSQVDVQPFGGFKLSGTGVKAGSPDYLYHFMDARCISENTARSGLVPTEQQSKIPPEPAR